MRVLVVTYTLGGEWGRGKVGVGWEMEGDVAEEGALMRKPTGPGSHPDHLPPANQAMRLRLGRVRVSGRRRYPRVHERLGLVEHGRGGGRRRLDARPRS